jgi:DNA repair exonuclease SbcCD ATPase subunit
MKLFIKKFKSLEDLGFAIPTQITGGNGLGKSTILEAISFVLTGKDLSGNEFKQVYDNRVDLHDAIADVSYFDNYGNEWQRIVQPLFQTNRAGIEEIKIKRSTECRKNGIVVNDFSDEFQDFYKFGTDYFFNQKEDLQRSIFIDILKSKLPDYDVNTSSLKLKELKKSKKIEVDLVKGLQDANKNIKDVPVPEIPTDIEKLNAEFLALSGSTNTDSISEINKTNNEASSVYLKKKSELSQSISDTEISISKIKSQIESETEQLETLKNSTFTPKQTEPTDQLEKELSDLQKKLLIMEYFTDLNFYASKYFGNNYVLVKNAAKIKEISERVFIFSGQESGCPLNKQECPTAKSNAEKTEKLVFDSENEIEIKQYKAENRRILEKEMSAINSEYITAKYALKEAEQKLNLLIESNKHVTDDNLVTETFFDVEKERKITESNEKIRGLNYDLEKLSTQLTEKQTELSNLIEPTPEKLPESVGISIELKNAHLEFERIKELIIGAKAINEYNKQMIVNRSVQIKEKQANLLQIIEQITTLTTEISDYFSNLTNIVKQEFAGDILIDVELLEYVISRDEYKGTFKITANGKTFPYECNGSLQNNTKLQILFNLQRLKGYTGVTIMDNCESSTTDPINSLGLNCVLAYATYDKELIIK